VATVKRAIEQLGGPITLVGHSYGGFVNTNAAYNNPNVTGLVYVAAFAPDEGQSLSDFIDATKLPKDFLIFDSGGFAYINPAMFPEPLLKMLIPLRLTSWLLCRSQLINQLPLKNLALQLGSNYRHGSRFLRVTI
jgi:pimeloyl-ACP methyl ester carboxylesterase